MLSVKYNNTTTCKIDGWLRNTIDSSKSINNGLEPDHFNFTDSHEKKSDRSADSGHSITGSNYQRFSKRKP